MERALLLGASDIYPKLGSTLQSCCIDIANMYNWYDSHYPMTGASFHAYQNARYTKERFFAGAHELCESGIDALAIDMSNHGTTIPINGVNHAAIVFSDSNWENEDSFGYDTDFKALFDAYPKTRFYMTADACESGLLAFKLVTPFGVNKFFAPPPDIQMMIDHNNKSGAIHRAIAPITPNVAYISGTGGKGYYSMDEGDGGAFTKTWTRITDPNATASAIAATLDAHMDSSQQPQAHGGLINEKWFS